MRERNIGSRSRAMRQQSGAVLFEAALCLPLFLIMAFAMIDFSLALRGNLSTMQALTGAGEALAAASAMENLNQNDCVHKAGVYFQAQLEKLSIGIGDVKMGGTDADPFILIATPFPFERGTYYQSSGSEPRGIELQAVFRAKSYFERATGIGLGALPMATIVILENSASCGGGCGNRWAAFYPNRSGSSAVGCVNL